MDIEALREKFTAIGTCESDADRLTLITALRDEIEADYNEHATTAERVSELETANKNLQENNMALFLRLGNQNIDVQTPPEENPDDDKKLSFDDLFNEKGELK